MPKLKLSGLGRLDGEYECPTLHDLTNTELHFIRQQSGISPVGIAGAVMEQDAGVAAAMAAVALTRIEKDFDLQQLWDAQFGSIVYDFSDQEEKQSPPDQPPSERNEDETLGGNSEESESSG